MECQVKPSQVKRGRGGRTTSSLPARESERWEERANELARQEIGFIASRGFANLKREEARALEQLDLTPFGPGKLRRDLPAHLGHMCATELLTPDDERLLFRRFNFLKFQANVLRAQLRPGRSSRVRVERIEWLLREAQRTLDCIVLANLRLVISLVKRITAVELNFDELLSDGTVALLRAAEKFDESRGFRFSTYATMVVRRDLYRALQLARRERQRFPLGETPLLQEHPASGDATLEQQRWVTTQKMADLMTELDPREREILETRFGFRTIGRKPSLQAIADLLGVCKERVRQLEKRALTKLRSMAEASGLSASL